MISMSYENEIVRFGTFYEFISVGFQLFAPSRSSAAEAITLAELSMSSMTTYSSGWCARSRMPGP